MKAPVLATSAGAEARGVRLTPGDVYRAIERRYAIGGRFNLDAACSRQNCLVDSQHECWPDVGWDAFRDAWYGYAPRGSRERGSVFCNPPYGEIAKWMRRAWGQIRHGIAERVVFLVPARTSSAWYEYARVRGARIVNIRKRIKFLGGGNKNRPFEHSILVILESAMVV